MYLLPNINVSFKPLKPVESANRFIFKLSLKPFVYI